MIPGYIKRDTKHISEAVFAGGCFWCIEAAFAITDGVIEAVSGYTGGSAAYPDYASVCTGRTGHYEAVRVRYNSMIISYVGLLEIFFAQIDPTDPGGQFADRGTQYRTAVFYGSEEQKKAASDMISALDSSGIYDKKIVTSILPASVFYNAEEHHQNYASLNTERYMRYAEGSGRKAYINSIWRDAGSPGELFRGGKYRKKEDEELKKTLTTLQYAVTRKSGTEPPFYNEYWDNHEPGIYADIVTGEPLFSSVDKYDSGTGWPSFSRPLAPENILYQEDKTLLQLRVEALSRHGETHLGHIFEDGPASTGVRYCMNSSSLRFIHKKALSEEGYPQYRHIFE